MTIRALLITATICTLFLSCTAGKGGFTSEELLTIHSADSIMRVLTIRDSLDLAVLRSTSRDLSDAALQSDDFTRLSRLMLATVTHPSQDGVGIAAPQTPFPPARKAAFRYRTGENRYSVHGKSSSNIQTRLSFRPSVTPSEASQPSSSSMKSTI